MISLDSEAASKSSGIDQIVPDSSPLASAQTSVLLHWQPPHSNGSEINRYHVQMSHVLSPEAWVEIYTGPDNKCEAQGLQVIPCDAWHRSFGWNHGILDSTVFRRLFVGVPTPNYPSDVCQFALCAARQKPTACMLSV